MNIVFFVPGIPKTAGSKRAFVNPKTGKPIITDDCKKGADWKADIKSFALKTGVVKQMDGPLLLVLEFFMPRPKYHYGTGKNSGIIKPSMINARPDKKPDLLKMARAVEDALTGIVWKDDAQICDERITKRYGVIPGVKIKVEMI